ncbi:unnamed protein product [Bursaphelenchus okinawaensis]|uniref:PR domain zinc finger protein 1 n=1 Tax=Bursaphelenchus okinawaensis TaxID=465554 RepID=A0A811JT05_9BILA|nr:unnamed protein product [Bursaphelenchus okinawaensis]CAG9081890.1 unnamed protein product [Bursaphelenchus okinawaensis]
MGADQTFGAFNEPAAAAPALSSSAASALFNNQQHGVRSLLQNQNVIKMPKSHAPVPKREIQPLVPIPSSADNDWLDMPDQLLANVSVFHVPDKPLQLQSSSTFRVFTSLPLNLTMRTDAADNVTGVWSTDYIPRGTRFGPLQGEVCIMNPSESTVMPAEASTPQNPDSLCHQGSFGQSIENILSAPKKWKIFSASGAHVVKLIDTSNTQKSNWMKNVNLARSRPVQNLVASQIDDQIYFYSVRNIPPNTELLFWYGKDYSQRIKVPANCAFFQNPAPAALPISEPAMPDSSTSHNEPLICEPSITAVSKTSEVSDMSPIAFSEPELARLTDHESYASSHSSTASVSSSPNSRKQPSEHSDAVERPISPHARANVIQSPLHRPVPLKQSLPTSSTQGTSSFFNPTPHFSELLQHWTRMAGLPSVSTPNPPVPPSQSGLWLPNPIPQLGSLPEQVPVPSNIGGRAAAEQHLLPSFASTPLQFPQAGGLPNYTSLYAMAAAVAGTPHPQTDLASQLLASQSVNSDFCVPQYPGINHLEASNSLHFGVPKPGIPIDAARLSETPKFSQSHVNGRTRYECSKCSKSFGQLSNLKVHLRTHTGEKPYKCKKCNKGFAQLAHLQKHDLVHTGEKPHQCDECGKRFSSTSNLKTHRRLHSGQRPYSCEMCKISFTQLVHLKLHKRTHTNERPFICSTCSRTYISPSGLRTHWKNTSCKPAAGELGDLEAYVDTVEQQTPNVQMC